MRTAELVGSLVDLLKRELKDFHFPHTDGSCADCNVYRYNVPSAQQTKIYPFVIVRLVECEINEDQSNDIGRGIATIAIALGVYCPVGPEEAGKLLDELNDVVLYILRKNRVLADKYTRLLPITVTVPEPDKQWHEFHMATVVTQWDFVIPALPLEE